MLTELTSLDVAVAVTPMTAAYSADQFPAAGTPEYFWNITEGHLGGASFPGGSLLSGLGL